ncbi:unnamed protein product [Phytophthora lilii]|uniref:Unnamed protein product n=1 Tax=Phytophthora lilii TaxID=2077276 RepID=A0A9W6WZ73_9STRA|nr:unnamed protein product [Phytophthora lilii]
MLQHDEEHDTKNVSTLSTLSHLLSFGEQTTSDECFNLRDYGFVDHLKSSSRSFCTGDLDSSIHTVFDVPIAEFSSTKLQNIVIDMRSAEVSHDIYSLAQDGGGHDPRFRYKPNSVFCNCTGPQDSAHGAPNTGSIFWQMALVPTNQYVIVFLHQICLMRY